MREEPIKDYLIGFDVMKREKGYCIVESITEPAPDQFESIFRKLFQNIRMLFKAAKQQLEGNSPSDDLKAIEERIQKYGHYCRRAIIKGISPQKKSELVWAFLTMLVYGQREVYHLCRVYKGKATTEQSELLDVCIEILDLLENAYIKKDVSLLATVYGLEHTSIYVKGYALLDKKGDKRVVYHLMVTIRQLYTSISPLMGMIS
jgi:hypothetical protein